ncbi:hypothetical protein CBL_12218 [Carabus blaptoides fortunei]
MAQVLHTQPANTKRLRYHRLGATSRSVTSHTHRERVVTQSGAHDACLYLLCLLYGRPRVLGSPLVETLEYVCVTIFLGPTSSKDPRSVVIGRLAGAEHAAFLARSARCRRHVAVSVGQLPERYELNQTRRCEVTAD